MTELEELDSKRSYDRRLARRLLVYLKPYRRVVLFSVLLLLVASVLRLVSPYLTKVAIDDAISKGDTDKLGSVGILFLGVLVFQFLFTFAQTYLMNWTGQQIMRDLRMEIFSHIQRLHLAYFDKHPVGRIMTRLTNDVETLNELFTSGVVSVFGDLFSLTFIVAVMLWLNWKLALLSFSVIPILFAASLLFKVKVRDSYGRVRSALARINAFLQENITGMSVVQIFVQERRMLEDFKTRNREYTRANLESILYYALFYPVVDLIGSLAVGLILWYGGIQVIDSALTLGAVVAFIQYSERFYKPISDLSEKFNLVLSAMASSERVFDLLDVKPDILEPQDPVELQSVQGGIEFQNVTFGYERGTPVLRDVCFRVSPGEKVAIVGATGSGKTTIISLLCRFYDVQQGRVLLDGTDVRDLRLSQLRSSIAIVLQDVFLFSGRVEDNIRLWERPISQAEVKRAARRVHAEDFIARLPGRYQSHVSERGASLSVGQRQLLAFARALAHDPRILVLDEATSSVDTETELFIQEAVQELMKGRTAVIIAHRLSTIQHCDRIIVLHKGEIIEEGSHRQLLERKGVYYRLYQLQYKEQLSATGTD